MGDPSIVVALVRLPRNRLKELRQETLVHGGDFIRLATAEALKKEPNEITEDEYQAAQTALAGCVPQE